MLARPHQGIVMNSDFFRRHPVNCGIIPCKSRKEMGKQAISNLKSKKLCNLSHLFTLRREELGGDEALQTFPLGCERCVIRLKAESCCSIRRESCETSLSQSLCRWIMSCKHLVAQKKIPRAASPTAGGHGRSGTMTLARTS